MTWIHTRHGLAFDLLDPRPEQVSILDIAHALSMICRYTGHAREHYSVAEHSVFVAQHVLEETGDRALAWAGLVHDAHEAYVGDVASPIKVALRAHARKPTTAFDVLDALVAGVVRGALGAPVTMPREIKHADLRMLATEAPQLLAWPPTRPWVELPAPYPMRRLECWEPREARRRFLSSVVELGPPTIGRAAHDALVAATLIPRLDP